MGECLSLPVGGLPGQRYGILRYHAVDGDRDGPGEYVAGAIVRVTGFASRFSMASLTLTVPIHHCLACMVAYRDAEVP